MIHQKIFAVLGVTSLAIITLVRSRADDGEKQPLAGAPPDSTRRADPYPECVKIFDGKTFRGWERGSLDVEHRRGRHARLRRKFAAGVHNR